MSEDGFNEEDTPERGAASDRGGVPAWYAEIFPAGPRDGFFEKIGAHALIAVDRGAHQLVVTFDNLSDAGYPGYDIEAWGGKFIRDSGWSHLGICAQGPTWYRDADLIARLEGLRDEGFFDRYDRVTFTGTSMGGFGALAFADLAPGATVLAFSPQSTLAADLVPWETRFAPGRAQDWSLPRSDAAAHIGSAGRVWVVYDPFMRPDRAHAARLAGPNVTALKAIGQGHKTAMVLRRMDHLKTVFAHAVEGSLSEAVFYRLTRDRRHIYIYRKAMEAHLRDRGKEGLIPRFTAAFRRQVRAVKQAQAPQAPAPLTAAPPDAAADAPPPVDAPTARRPRTLGNAWGVQAMEGGLRYLSDQYRGRLMGFEERGGVTLAEAPAQTLGMLALGGPGVLRPLPERYDYHVTDAALTPDAAPLAAEAQAVATLRAADARYRALRHVIALSAPQAGMRPEECAPDAPLPTRLASDLRRAMDALAPFGRSLHVDRIALDQVLAGAPDLTEAEATALLGDIAESLRARVAGVTGQATSPLVVLSQSAGSRRDGRAEAILAEGRMEITHPAARILVAAPSYMLRLMPETEATLTPEDRLWLDEMEARAVAAHHAGERWHCPTLREVRAEGSTLRAIFSTLSPLRVDAEAEARGHGFALHGSAARITAVEVTGAEVRLTLDAPPLPDGDAPVHLSYAWGAAADGAADRPANTGALRDAWAQESLLQPGRKLHRFALAARLPVTGAAS